MDPEFLGDLLQGLAALRQPLDRLGLVLGREPAPLPLLHRSFPVLVDPTLRGCPPSRGRLTRLARPLAPPRPGLRGAARGLRDHGQAGDDPAHAAPPRPPEPQAATRSLTSQTASYRDWIGHPMSYNTGERAGSDARAEDVARDYMDQYRR